MKKLSLHDFDQVYLDLSWEWLNDPEIKRLTNTPDFSREDQQRWFGSLPSLADYRIWGVAIGGTPSGVAGIKGIADGRGEYYGYLGRKEFWGKGYGQQILQAVCEKARTLGLEALFLEVINDNGRAINSYLKFGFEQFERDAAKTYMEIWLK